MIGLGVDASVCPVIPTGAARRSAARISGLAFGLALRLAALDHPERPGPPVSALPGLRVAGVRAGGQDRPAAQGIGLSVRHKVMVTSMVNWRAGLARRNSPVDATASIIYAGRNSFAIMMRGSGLCVCVSEYT